MPPRLCEAVFSFKIIKEYSADSPGFIPVPDEKIIICPFPEFRIVGWMMLITDILELLMKVPRIFFDHIVRREINSATEPPGIFSAAGHLDLEVSHIHMHDRHHWIVGMQYYRHTSGKKIGRHLS